MKAIIFVTMLIIASTVFAAPVEINFAWDANIEPNLAGYNLWMSDFSGGGYGMTQSFGVVTTGKTTVDIDPGETRYFVMTAVNDAGLESGYSNEVSFFLPIPEPHQPPANPRNLRAEAHHVL